MMSISGCSRANRSPSARWAELIMFAMSVRNQVSGPPLSSGAAILPAPEPGHNLAGHGKIARWL
jgi:hypothetical protein